MTLTDHAAGCEEREEDAGVAEEEDEEDAEEACVDEVLEYYRTQTVAAETALEAALEQVEALTGEVQVLRAQLAGHGEAAAAEASTTGAVCGRRTSGDKKQQEYIEALVRRYEPEGGGVPAASPTASRSGADGDDAVAAASQADEVSAEVEEEEEEEEAPSSACLSAAVAEEEVEEAPEEDEEDEEEDNDDEEDEDEDEDAEDSSEESSDEVVAYFRRQAAEAEAALEVSEQRAEALEAELQRTREELEGALHATAAQDSGLRDYEHEIAALQGEVRALHSVVENREIHGGTAAAAVPRAATGYSETVDGNFRETVERGLVQAKKVLDTARDPKLAADVHHEYTDKFLLAEFLTGAGCAGVLLCLETLGVTGAHVATLQGWVREGRSVTLRVRSTETCEFEKKTSREVEDATKHVTEVKGVLGTTKVTDKVVRRVDEWFWGFGATYQVVAYGGTDVAGAVVLREGARRTRVKTTTEAAPRKKVAERQVAEVDATWLVRQLNAAQQVEFRVDRAARGCHTPRRNAEVEAALAFFREVRGFFGGVERYLAGELFPLEQNHKLDVGSANAEGVFVPLLPLLEEGGGGGGGEGKEAVEAVTASATEAHGVVSVAAGQQGASGTVLGVRDLGAFLGEERRALEERVARVQATLAGGAGLITGEEGTVLVVADHGQRVAAAYAGAMAYVEQLLRQQVVAAIGKEVTSGDFTEYMRYHLRKLLADAYAPRGFSYAVRRGEHNPEGTVSLEQTAAGGGVAEPVVTVVRRLEAGAGAGAGAAPMRFALNASSEVRFGGERFVHSYICHRFSTEAMPSLQLVGRARQFSGFVLLVGAIGGADVFLPKAAMIVQNKDDFKLPLLLDEIPTPKEFRDAIESLSPEQQRFAKAYRGMQLEATLFGVCVVQIKPQLERVLNLPADSLTKEIKLTQDLLELFVEYQIPGDLLSYQADACEDDADVSGGEKVDKVRGHVAAMKEMLKEAKEAELEEERMVKEKKKLESSPVQQTWGQDPEPVVQSREDVSPFYGEKIYEQDFGCDDTARAPLGGDAAKCRVVPPTAPKVSQAWNVASPPPSSLERGLPEKPAEPTPKQEVAAPSSDDDSDDISKLPQVLERKFEALDEDNCLRPTILKTGDVYQKTHQKGLLSKPATQRLHADAQKQEKDRAYDLLDALTRSGALAVEEASLHVVVASTHCFDKTLMDAVVQDNVNPIEKVERSVLIAASAIHCQAAEAMLREEQVGRVRAHCPKLFLE